MKRLTALVPLLIALAGAAAVPARSESPPGEREVHAVALRFERTDGTNALLRFEVVAASPALAEEVARVAAEELGIPPIATGRVSAQWLPWQWKWDAHELPVPVAYNPTGAPESVGPSAVIAGLQAWSGVSTSSFRFRYAGITENTASILESGPDSENVISWASIPCERGCVLGITSKEAVHEVDMLLNSNPEAAAQLGVGTRLDWRTVILHELGHVVGLEHSCPVPFGPCTEAEADAVMYFSYRGILRKLAPDDIAGVSALYPVATATAPPSPAPGASPTPTPFPELVVILERGWNLVVLPPGPVAPAAAALPCLEALYAWDGEAWSAWLRDLGPALRGFDSLAAGRAYWAWTRGSCAHVFP